jgi:cytochrome c553
MPLPSLRVPRFGTICAFLAALALACTREEQAPVRESVETVEVEETAFVDETAEALRLKGDVEAGAQVYETCAVCHLPSGAGRDDGTFPNLAGQHPGVLVKQMLDVRRGRRRNPVMQPHVELGDLQEIADVAAYIATLPRTGSGGTGDGAALAEGQRLYSRDCAGCHGARGEGDAARLVPALAGQHYAYLLRQLRHIAGKRRRDSHPEMAGALGPYRDAELQAVADYAGRLDPASAP